MLRNALIGAFALLTSAGCISTAKAVVYEDAATEDEALAEKVKARFAALHDANSTPNREFEIWEGRAPGDLIVRGTTIEVPADAPYQLISSFRIKFLKLPGLTNREEARRDVRRIVEAAGGNFAVTVITVNSAGHATEARGFILKSFEKSGPMAPGRGPLKP